jgi:hypothetical protein
VHPDGHLGESSPEEATPVQLRADASPWATAGLDASADALPDAVGDAHPELSHLPDASAGKLAAPAPDVLEPDASLLPPERLAQQAWAAPGTPDEVPYAGQSCAATESADAAAQPEPQVSL